MFQHILVLWDGSDLSERAFAIARDLGQVYGAEVTAVCVVERPRSHRRTLISRRHHHGRRGGSPLSTGDPVQALFAERHADDRAGPRPAELTLVHGHDVVADLLELAYEHGSDLVVVGHHSRHGPDHILPHGLTERLLQSAALPVLVVGG
jgi:nucleotide-binding universal stress UspA family protein